MTEIYGQTFELMEKAFHNYEKAMPEKPEITELSFGKTYRYKEKNIYQAIIQKLARVLSLIKAAHALQNNGFFQEQAILQRAIDETNEDILFLAYAITNDEITELHNTFLECFWEEEIDESGNIMDSKQNRGMVSRQKIRAYISNIEAPSTNPSRSIQTSKTIHKTYSGFVHGASPQIMDMYGGNPPHFHTSGMLNTPRHEEYYNDIWNYTYRTLISHIIVAKAWGFEDHANTLIEHKLLLESDEGKNY